MDNKVKELIFNKLYKKLHNVEIIPYKDSIWFVDRENEYWYLEFEKGGMLWWRYGFFNNFFEMFSLDYSKFEPILSAWVEEVLNHKVSATQRTRTYWRNEVVEVLNHKVNTTYNYGNPNEEKVEEVLNHKVNTTLGNSKTHRHTVEEVLNHKVSATNWAPNRCKSSVEEALNHKITMTSHQFRTPILN